jgi:hypothetical protein
LKGNETSKLIDAVKNVQNLHPVQLEASLKNANKLTFHRPKYINPQSRKVAPAPGSWQPLVKNSQALSSIFFYQTAGKWLFSEFQRWYQKQCHLLKTQAKTRNRIWC